MPPKKKGGKKEEETAATPEDAARLKLVGEARDLAKQIEREAKDFNEFQQQREKLNYFWIVEKKDLEDKKSMLRNKERELQDLEEKHQVEIKIYKQRLKHLLHEFQNEITLKKTGAEMTLKLKQDDHRGQQGHHCLGVPEYRVRVPLVHGRAEDSGGPGVLRLVHSLQAGGAVGEQQV